jgi:hypothetical protein
VFFEIIKMVCILLFILLRFVLNFHLFLNFKFHMFEM